MNSNGTSIDWIDWADISIGAIPSSEWNGVLPRTTLRTSLIIYSNKNIRIINIFHHFNMVQRAS